MSRHKINLVVEGSHLDLYEDEKIVFKRQIKDAKDISKVFTDFTHEFKVPVSKRNNKVFKHAFRKDSGDFDPRGFYSSVVEVNGEEYNRGYVELLGAEYKSGKAHSYKLRHYGKLLLLSRVMGDDTFQDIRAMFTDYNFPQEDQVFHDLLTVDEDTDLTQSASYWSGYDKEAVNDNVRIFLNNDTTKGFKFDTSTSFVAGDFSDNEINVAYTDWTTNSTEDEETYKGVTYNGISVHRQKASLRETKVLEAIENFYGPLSPNGFKFSRGLDSDGYPTSVDADVVSGKEHFFGSEEFKKCWILFYNKEIGGTSGYRGLIFENDWDPGTVEDNGVRPHRGFGRTGFSNENCFNEDEYNNVWAPAAPYKLRDNAYSDYYLETNITAGNSTDKWTLYVKFKGEVVYKKNSTGNLVLNTETTFDSNANSRTVKGDKILIGETDYADCGDLTFEVFSEDNVSLSGTITIHQHWVKREGLWQTGRLYDRTHSFENTISTTASNSSNYTLESNAPNLKIMDYLKGLQKVYNLVFTVEKDGNNEDIIVAKTYNSYYDDGDVIDLTKETDTQEYNVSKPVIYTDIKFQYKGRKTFQTREFDNTNPTPYGDLYHEVKLNNQFTIPKKDYKVENPFEMILLNNPTDGKTGAADTPVFVYSWLVDNGYDATEIEMFRHYGEAETVGNDDGGLLLKDQSHSAYDEVDTINMMSKHRDIGATPTKSLLYSTNVEDERTLTQGAQDDDSLFNRYWKESVVDLFDRFAKVHNFNARLSRGTINKLGLDKTVLISDNPYRINNYEVDLMSGKSKLDLVSLNQPKPAASVKEAYESGFSVNTIVINSFTSSTDLGVFANTSTTLTVDASGNNTLMYKWFKNGTEVSGETGSTYTFTPVDDDAVYVEVSDEQYAVDSTTLTFEVFAATDKLTAISVDDTTPLLAGQDLTVTITGTAGVPYALTLTEVNKSHWIDTGDFDSLTGTIPSGGSDTVTLSVPRTVTFNGGSFKVRATNTDVPSNYFETGTITQADGTGTFDDNTPSSDGQEITLTITGPANENFDLSIVDESPADWIGSGALTYNTFGDDIADGTALGSSGYEAVTSMKITENTKNVYIDLKWDESVIGTPSDTSTADYVIRDNNGASSDFWKVTSTDGATWEQDYNGEIDRIIMPTSDGIPQWLKDAATDKEGKEYYYNTSDWTATTEVQTLTVGGTNANVVVNEANEVMRLHLDPDFSGGQKTTEAMVLKQNTGFSSFTKKVAANTVSGSVIFGALYVEEETSNYTYTIPTDDRYTNTAEESLATYWFNVMKNLDGNTFTWGSTSVSISYDSTNSEIEISGITGKEGVGNIFVVTPDILDTDGNTVRNTGSGNNDTTSFFGEGENGVPGSAHAYYATNNGIAANPTSITIDPDTSNTVYSTSLSGFQAETDESATDYLDRIGDAVAALETNITYDGTVNDGYFFKGASATYETGTLTGSEFVFNSSTTDYDASATEVETVSSWDDVSGEVLWFYRYNGNQSGLFSNGVANEKVRIEVGDAEAVYNIVSVHNDGLRRGYKLGASPDSSSGTPILEDGDSATLSIRDESKYIDIDMGTKTAIDHSATLTLGGGSNGEIEVDGMDAVQSSSGTATTITVYDYSNTEVTSFTQSSSSSTDDKSGDVVTAIKDAINNNEETPIDFGAAESGKVVTATADESGYVDGKWRVTVNNHGQSTDAGTITVTQATTTEGTDAGTIEFCKITENTSTGNTGSTGSVTKKVNVPANTSASSRTFKVEISSTDQNNDSIKSETATQAAPA